MEQQSSRSRNHYNPVQLDTLLSLLVADLSLKYIPPFKPDADGSYFTTLAKNKFAKKKFLHERGKNGEKLGKLCDGTFIRSFSIFEICDEITSKCKDITRMYVNIVVDNGMFDATQRKSVNSILVEKLLTQSLKWALKLK